MATIYIQSENGSVPSIFDSSSAMYGAIETGQNYILITNDEVVSGKWDNLIRTNLFVGSVEFMRNVFSRVGLDNIRVPYNSNRDHIVSTISEVREKFEKDGLDVFIKPFKIKEFTGFVLDKWTISMLNPMPDDLEVMVYDKFDHKIVSEFRCYIHNRQPVYIANYSGGLFYMVDEKYLNDVISDNDKNNFPVSYTIDIGILENGENVVIEYNDMWAIGNYGMPNDEYLRALKDRYFQIVKGK